MQSQELVVYFSPDGSPPPPVVSRFAAEEYLEIKQLGSSSELLSLVNRRPLASIIVKQETNESCIDLCRELKSDSCTAIIPVIFFNASVEADTVIAAMRAGADEVLTESMEDQEQLARLRLALRRAERDVSVNPTTRLPGTAQIERDIGERLRSGDLFAVCYADLDYFKEFNDRYGYNEGDQVIRLLSRILRDVVKGHSPDGFVGHIGGDDFIFNVPLHMMDNCCQDILETFDELIPYHYHEDDRNAGYFLGKDRRGIVHRMPLMSLSIGVVTNEHRSFTHTAKVNELVTEMKAYAKTMAGSVYTVDRRRDRPVDSESPRVKATAK